MLPSPLPKSRQRTSWKPFGDCSAPIKTNFLRSASFLIANGKLCRARTHGLLAVFCWRPFPPRLQELVGYGVYRGLIGHIDKKSPAHLLNGGGEFESIWNRT